jgi:radical SAM protein with 4Fe4S-binding SPASM domain
MFCKLPHCVYFRKYGNIGYLYNQVSQNEVVLDECGAVFISEIRKDPEAVSTIAERIGSRFLRSDQSELNSDLMELLSQLEVDGFVLMGRSVYDFDEREPHFSYLESAHKDSPWTHTDDDHMPSSDFLKQHFATHPELFSVQIELTSFCNLKCIHCYLGDEHAVGGMPKDQVFCLLDQLRDMGTLKVAFSGGEVLSRADLDEILCHARKNDFCITLLTNNTLLSARILDSIKVNNVALVQVSVYSMVPEVHDTITGKHGSLKSAIGNIDKLAAQNIPVLIACPVMKQNLDSFARVVEWGVARGFRVKPDIMLMARSDFSTNNLMHRLDMDEARRAIECLLSSDPEYQESLKNKDIIGKPINSEDGVCGIGRSTMCVSAEGDFYPCSGLKLKLGNFNTSSVHDVWKNSPEIIKLRNIKKSSYIKCISCRSIDYCHLCPAKFFNESGGDIYGMSDYFCGVAEINREIAESYISKAGSNIRGMAH